LVWRNETKLEIPGIDKDGVFYARKILRDLKNGKEVFLGNRIGVIGGGNVAFDVANSLKIDLKKKKSL